MLLDDMTTQLLAMFDVPLATAQSWVNESYRSFVAQSKWLTAYASLGSTVAGTASYALPANVVEIDSLLVNGVEYMRAGEWDIPAIVAGDASLPSGESGAFAQSSSSAGGDQFTLYPTPTSVLAITGKVVQVPTDLVTGSGAGSSPVVSTDLHGAILNGAISIGYLRSDELAYMAQAFDPMFQQGVQIARARKISRVSGRGPFRAQIAGLDF